MENITKSNVGHDDTRKPTLRTFYKSLPATTNPRRELIDEVCAACKVPYTTARSWFVYGIRPSKPGHIAKLSAITGIAPEDMWDD